MLFYQGFYEMRKDGGADYALVRGLTRGLDLLKALNSQEGGRSTLAQLAEVTGLHRTTVRRLLETLIAEGYVRRSASDDRYCLALNVRSLAEAIAHKADALARRFEDQAIEQMVRDAKAALRRGTEPAEIARQMGL